ncbi:uroporphyrinogen-III synthase [Plantactinospora sp. B5E13]|uniref:uroporphyrinogen-III synthase n=1 Tax=unclassified Plantactinospora TaxID=2631981 RepID=UPI00325E21E7
MVGTDGIVSPLAGFSVAVATERRQHPLLPVLEEAGARIVQAQALRVAPQPDRDVLTEATVRCLSAPLDEVVVSSAFGFRAWMAAAQAAGLGKRLISALSEGRLLARDAAAADAMREFGLTEIWSTAAASTEELFRYLLAHPTPGGRVAVEIGTPALSELCDALTEHGVEAVELRTYRTFPAHPEPLRRLVDQVIRRLVDALVLTNPVATGQLTAAATRDGRLDDLLNALCDDVAAVCLGRRTAEPLRALGVPALAGANGFVEELAAGVHSQVRARALRFTRAARSVEVRGHGVVIDGRFRPVPPGPIAVLRVLAARPGQVVSYDEIRRASPGWSEVDNHALEMAVFRLRRHLDDMDVVQTITRRGYRLAADNR